MAWQSWYHASRPTRRQQDFSRNTASRKIVDRFPRSPSTRRASCQCSANCLSYQYSRIYPPDALPPHVHASLAIPEVLEQAALMTVPGNDVWTSALERAAPILRPGCEALTTASSFTPLDSSADQANAASAWCVANCEAHHIVPRGRVQRLHVQPWVTTVQRSLIESHVSVFFTFLFSLLFRRWRQVHWRVRFFEKQPFPVNSDPWYQSTWMRSPVAVVRRTPPPTISLCTWLQCVCSVQSGIRLI
jgi:hypothetical protein